jgi:hypothetical protein
MQRLSLRESRRLQRRFLQLDDRHARPLIFLAGGTRPGEPKREPAPAPESAPRGPYEWQYPVSDGYASQRTIIVP